MGGCRLTPAARNDLSQIWDFTTERWDMSQAETYLLEIRSAFERIAEQPGRGRIVDEIRLGYRRYAIGSHLIFYTTQGEDVDVIRVLHQRMDPSHHL